MGDFADLSEPHWPDQIDYDDINDEDRDYYDEHGDIIERDYGEEDDDLEEGDLGEIAVKSVRKFNDSRENIMAFLGMKDGSGEFPSFFDLEDLVKELKKAKINLEEITSEVEKLLNDERSLLGLSKFVIMKTPLE